jgi:hypothetical protein
LSHHLFASLSADPLPKQTHSRAESPQPTRLPPFLNRLAPTSRLAGAGGSDGGMEIDEAVRGCSDRRMRTKYGNAVYVVQRAFALYPFEEVAFSFNGGKDSTVLLHLIRAGYYLYKKDAGDVAQMDAVKNCPLRTIYFESPCAFPEINSFTYETVST